MERGIGQPVRFPEMRLDVVGALRALADPVRQEQDWGVYNPDEGRYDDLTININILFDCRVLPEPSFMIGAVVRASDVNSLEALGNALLPMINDLGDAPDEQYLADPRWNEVTRRAQAALETLGTPE